MREGESRGWGELMNNVKKNPKRKKKLMNNVPTIFNYFMNLTLRVNKLHVQENTVKLGYKYVFYCKSLQYI